MTQTRLLKPSRYNFSCECRDGDTMLMCNFLRGRTSFAKVKKDAYGQIEKLLGGADIELSEESEPVKLLHMLGYLIDADEDEIMKIRAKYYDVLFGNMLLLIIMPTEQCNLRCKYCYEDYQLGEMTEQVQESIVKYVLKNMKYYNSLHISWFGGEPLCALNAVKNISEKTAAICNHRKKAYKFAMTTNAYGLSPEVFDSLYKLKIIEYQITLDGSKEQHDFQRARADGAGTFDVIFNNLKYIKDNIAKYPKVKIILRVNITRDVYEHFSDFLSLYKENFANDAHFELLMKLAGNWGRMEGSEFKSHLMSEDIINVHEIAKEFNIFNMDDIMIYDAEGVFMPAGHLCYASRKNGFVIRPDGAVAKCTMNFKEKDQIGNIDKDGNMHIDQYKHAKWYLDLKLRETCQECIYLPVCCGGSCTYVAKFGDPGERCFNADLKDKLGLYLDYMAQYVDFYDLGKVI